MNSDFFLTINRQLIAVGRPNSERQYYMAIYSNDSHPVQLFTSYNNPSKADMIEVGKAYAKRLNIIFKEPD